MLDEIEQRTMEDDREWVKKSIASQAGDGGAGNSGAVEQTTQQ
uniref:Uncharacterized protein n=1 Tax=mine drainage metagenome TaxID=410659 RepID=E6QMK3_9ZZZZ